MQKNARMCDFYGGSMVKTLLLQETWVLSLAGALRSHMPRGVTKKKKKKNREGDFPEGAEWPHQAPCPSPPVTPNLSFLSHQGNGLSGKHYHCFHTHHDDLFALWWHVTFLKCLKMTWLVSPSQHVLRIRRRQTNLKMQSRASVCWQAPAVLAKQGEMNVDAFFTD